MGRRKRGWKEATGLSIRNLQSLIEKEEAESAGFASRRAVFVAEFDEVDA